MGGTAGQRQLISVLSWSFRAQFSAFSLRSRYRTAGAGLASGVRVGDVAQVGEDLAESGGSIRTQVGGPFGLYLGDGRGGEGYGAGAAWRDPDEPGTGVGRVRHPFDVSGLGQLVDQETGGLLGDLCLLGQGGEPAAAGCDALEEPGLRGGEVVEAGRCRGGEDAGLHRPPNCSTA